MQDYQINYIKDFVKNYLDEGKFNDYLVFTNRANLQNTNLYCNENQPADYVVYFSSKITITNNKKNQFTVEGIRNNSYSQSRMYCFNFSDSTKDFMFNNQINSTINKTVIIPTSEIVYTNAKQQIGEPQTDVNQYANFIYKEVESSNNTSTNQSFPIDKNDFFIIPVLLLVLIFMLFLKWCFPMKGGKNL